MLKILALAERRESLSRLSVRLPNPYISRFAEVQFSVPIDRDQLQKFSVKGTDPDARHDEKVIESRRVIEYNSIDRDTFSAINEVECLGSYGTKIETLIRHLLYLQKHEPDAKSIVFSAWADSLHSQSVGISF
jgi:hypothetical protein